MLPLNIDPWDTNASPAFYRFWLFVSFVFGSSALIPSSLGRQGRADAIFAFSIRHPREGMAVPAVKDTSPRITRIPANPWSEMLCLSRTRLLRPLGQLRWASSPPPDVSVVSAQTFGEIVSFHNNAV